jgi:hypothetical protein
MSWGPRRLGGALAALAACGSVVAAIPSPSVARTRPDRRSAGATYVSGHLNVRGYTVALVGYNGKYVSGRSQTFRLRAPASFVTVQLIDARGTYAGPVVFGGTSSRVITGIKAGTNLGTIDVVAAKGYAHLARKLARKYLDPSRWAYAHRGVPIANGRNLGLVNFKGKRNGGTGPGQDEAHLGIPNEFDIAVPGTHIIKELAPAQKYQRISAASRGLARASAVGGFPAATGDWLSSLSVGMRETVNADASGITVSDINTEMQNQLNISLPVVELTNPNFSLVELNCNGLSYCSQSGTGEACLNCFTTPYPGQYAAFPAVSLDPATGFGELIGPAVPNDGLISPGSFGQAFVLYPHANSSQIGSGNVITTDATFGGVTTDTPQTLGFVFQTTPAITSYSDTAGHSGTITYPDTTGFGSPDGPPIQVATGPNGDVVVTLTFYRPQRPGVAGAGEAPFMDIGHLGYALSVLAPGQNQLQTPCDPSDYSNLSPTLSLITASLPATGPNACVLVDSAPDRAATPGSTSTLSFTVDLTRWLATKGVSFPVSKALTFNLSGNVLSSTESSFSYASQSFALQRMRSTSTGVACSPSSVVVGQASNCTATVNDTDVGTQSTPTGSVSFSSDTSGGELGPVASSCTLSATSTAGQASCSVSYTPGQLGSGTHTITASYGGDSSHEPSSAKTTVTVTKRSTSTGVSCSPASVMVGQASTCTASVIDTDVGMQSTPTGSVSFSSDTSGGSFSGPGSCTLAATGTAGQASCSVSYTPGQVGSGTHTITASYGGDSTHQTSSGTTTVTVT